MGLDGGSLPGDGNASRDYMVEASLDQSFDLTNGTNWKLSLLPRGFPKLKGSTLWSNPSASTIFSYGGQDLNEVVTNGNDIFTLNTTSNKWFINSTLINTQRLTNGAAVNVPNLGKGFYIGGYQANYTSSSAPNDGLNHFATSMIQFDTVTKVSSLIDAPFLPVQFGALSYIPIGGGILLYFGGETPSTANVVEDLEDFKINNWDFVWVYDIKGNMWHRQSTSGSAAPRTRFCTSTVYDSESKSWQIWAVGGGDFQNKHAVDTVSILSLPSFHWFSAGPATSRMATSCERVGSQIFVFGGSQGHPWTDRGGKDYPAIAFVYDTNKQTSVSTFVATSTSYAAPTSIREAILSARTPATWAAPAVESLFMSTASPLSSSGHYGRPISGSAIAGIVVGVVSGILIVVVCILVWFHRRRQASLKNAENSVWLDPKTELDAKETEVKGAAYSIAELDDSPSSKRFFELDAEGDKLFTIAELHADSVHELHGDSRKSTCK
jgi:hypothetical protein